MNCELDPADTGQDPVGGGGPCEHCEESSGSTKSGITLIKESNLLEYCITPCNSVKSQLMFRKNLSPPSSE